MEYRTDHQSSTQEQGLRELTDFGIINGHRLRGDPEKFILIADERQAISCTPAEYRIVERLLCPPNTPVAFAQLRDGIYLPDVDHRAVMRAISTLRQKIAPLGIQITNVKTYGYMLSFAHENEKR
jgi:DNA-binding response OmpR family regulator